MPRTLKWIVTIASGVVVFAGVWWLCARLGRSTGDAIGIAAIPSALLTLPLAWWAGREPKEAPPDRNAFEGDLTGTLLQTRDIHGDVHIHPQQAAPADGQVVVGLIPHEPPNFQVPEQIEVLAGLAGSVCVVCAVTGQRGVGKTQVAAAYARQRVRDGWLVAWTGAQSTDLVQAGMVELADRLRLREPGDDPDTTTTRLRDHLQTRTTPALLVFDNLTRLDDIQPYLPAASMTQVVITTTLQGAERMGRKVPVDVFDLDTALRFLREATGLDDDNGARELASEVGRLPIALAQAAARIRAGWDYPTYLDHFRRFPVDQYLTRRDGDSYPHGAAAAILIALEPFGDSELLETLAVLSPDGVSREILATGRDPSSVDEELAQLHEASVIEFAGGNRQVIMHRLVQRVIRDRCHAAGTYPQVLSRETQRLDQLAFDHADAWRLRQLGGELVRQIEELWHNAGPHPMDSHESARLLDLRTWSVRHLIATAALARAIPLARTVHDDCRMILGDTHPKTLGSANNLAHAYKSAGRPTDAIPLHEQTLAVYRRILGDTHLNTLGSANNLAHAYGAAGRLTDAIPLHEQTLAHCRRVLGDDHPNTLTSANNLASTYRSAGRLTDAIPLHKQTLTDRRRTLGDDHPDTLTSANNLAHAYGAAGRLTDAIPLHEQTLADRRRTLGDDHPDTLISANNLAHAYGSVGRLTDAIPLYEQTFADRRRTLGDDHLDTLISANDLAYTYKSAGRPTDAIPLFEQTLADCLRVLGDSHPLTGLVRRNLRAARGD